MCHWLVTGQGSSAESGRPDMLASLHIEKVLGLHELALSCADCCAQGGAAVLSLQGPLRVEPLVAQGCRPLTNSTWLVDKCENNIILQVMNCIAAGH